MAGGAVVGDDVDEFGWSPEPGDHQQVDAQKKFWDEEVKPRLPKRMRGRGGVGPWDLNSGLYHVPPEAGLDGTKVTVATMCAVKVFVWAPTLFPPHRRVIEQQCCKDSQAPCPHGGWACDTTHKTWTSRYVCILQKLQSCQA